MNRRICVTACLLAGLAAQAPASLIQGKVTNQAGRALSGASVTLVPQGLKTTTANDGTYSLTTSSSFVPDRSLLVKSVGIQNDVLELVLAGTLPVKVEIYDTRGVRVRAEEVGMVSSGVYRMDLGRMDLGAGIWFVKATLGSQVSMIRYTSMQTAMAKGAQSAPQVGSALARVAAVGDSLRVTASGYTSKSIAVHSLDTTIDVKLDTILATGGYALGNSPVPTSGCGKSTVKSGTYKMDNRDYTVDVPANYDPNKPSRLVFGMHCMGSSRQGVINDQYYQLKPRDTDKTTIFVAMQGESDGTWQQGANDHKFFENIHKHLTSNLCIDSSRVFSLGFSFGAMFTNSLSRNHQGLLRAVVTYAPADYNIYLPPTTID
ncbi:MAG TPA: carboxypeptidase-like regulatory domain-containing protein, partial [Fibrobacteria bacterium]|nr:carboxypeptidase-like regulatory domain-containing protein [Fibrobacteria bacterium]